MTPQDSIARRSKSTDSECKGQQRLSFSPPENFESNCIIFRGARLVWSSPRLNDFQPVFLHSDPNHCFAD